MTITTDTTAARIAAIEARQNTAIVSHDQWLQRFEDNTHDLFWLLAELKAARAALHRLLVLDDWETAAEYLNRGAE